MNSLMQPRGRDRSDDNLIPLINIVFLLLIFFMIAGQISQIAADDIEPPASVSDAPVEPQAYVLTMSRAGQLALNGEPVVLEHLGERIGPMEGNPTVAFKADKNLTAADIDPVFAALRSAGVVTITLFAQVADVAP